MNKFTPGPWSVNEENYEFEVHSGKLSVEAGDYFIAQVDEGLCQEANARLIAAAPDLLDALESILEYAESGWDHTPICAVVARSVISKANGVRP